MIPQDKAAPGLEEQIAYIGESIDGECECFMCRHNRAILASLERLAKCEKDAQRYQVRRREFAYSLGESPELYDEETDALQRIQQRADSAMKAREGEGK